MLPKKKLSSVFASTANFRRSAFAKGGINSEILKDTFSKTISVAESRRNGSDLFKVKSSSLVGEKELSSSTNQENLTTGVETGGSLLPLKRGSPVRRVSN